MKQALIFWGGWDGHDPKGCAEIFQKELEKAGFEVQVEDNLDILADGEGLKKFDLIVPIWTMGAMTPEQSKGLAEAVESGVGLGGFHGGAGDAFRGNLGYEWMVGGMFVGHPYVGEYTVELTGKSHEITAGMADSFEYESEQYYMMTDPGNEVLATTVYEHEDKKVVMPVVWTKNWKAGKVFYSALGHSSKEFIEYPEVLAMTIRGMKWAAR